MFSIKESLGYGWQKFKSNKSVWATTLVILVLTYLSGGTSRHDNYDLVSLLAFVALLLARVGYTKLILKIADGETFEWPDALENLFKTGGIFWKFYLVAIAYGVLVGLGFILFIVPGLIALTVYFFSQLIVVDLGLGPIAAMKESALITKGHRLKLLGFLIVIVLVNIVGAIALGIGLFITIPVSMFAMVNVYRKLSSEKTSLKTV